MKKVAYVLIGLVVLYLILALIGPSKVDVSRQITINRPAEQIRPKLSDYKFHNENWNPWADLDPNMKVAYMGEAGQVGHAYEWDGNKDVRSGKSEITAITPDSVTQKLMFGGRDGGTSYLILKPMGDSTVVDWQMKSEFPFFVRPMMLFMNMDKMIGGMYDKGLAKFKTVMEQAPAETAVKFEITEQEWPERMYIGKREKVSTENNMEKLTAFFGDNYSKIFTDLGKNKIEPMSAPSAIFFSWEEKQTDVAAVAAVAKGTRAKGWETWTIPASKVVTVTYYGPDAGTIDAHNAIGKYMKDNNKEQAYVIEEYVTDREMEKDPARWQTNIFYVLK